MKLYFARHGHTSANINARPSKVNSEIDEPLDSLGQEQAHHLAEQLKDVKFDAIISSPLKRAYETAEITDTYHSLDIIIDPSWREREIGGIYMDIEQWNDIFNFNKSIQLDHGEDLSDFFKRVYDAVDDLKLKYANKTILVVSHGGVHSALYAYANKLELTGNIRVHPIRNCEYHIYDL
ncbi:MAG TPA: histidine phosphatase family protein [Candidatus Microsaccharimonas sp.]|jgi:broad specificity phosphatase PhoE